MSRMKKLELKHLAPYLPYGVKFLHIPDNEVFTLNALYDNGDAFSWDLGETSTDMIKPFLRPLSDLTQEELRAAGFNSHIDYLTYELQNPKNKYRYGSDGKLRWRVESAPYEMIEYLFRNHFDVFGLIEKGLAIDKNTLDQ